VTDTNVFKLTEPGTFADLLTEVLRNGERALLAQAVEAEVSALLGQLTDHGWARLVRHGHLPEREIMTGIGPVAVRGPGVRDRVGEGSGRIRFSSAILPPYVRRSKSLEVLIPILYLKGVSTGDFEEALVAPLGQDAGGLSAATVGRLKEAWSEEHGRWSKRDLSAKRLRVLLGRRYPWCRPGSRMSRSVSWRSSVPRPREKGARRLDRRRARGCAILEGIAARPEAARAGDGSRVGGRRRRARLLNCANIVLESGAPSFTKLSPNMRANASSSQSVPARPMGTTDVF
jgi:hypothetical protein